MLNDRMEKTACQTQLEKPQSYFDKVIGARSWLERGNLQTIIYNRPSFRQ